MPVITESEACIAFQAQAREEFETSKDSSYRFSGALLLIFVLALFARIAFNYWLPHANNFASCDAYEYISNAQALLKVIGSLDADFFAQAASCFAGTASAGQIESLKEFLAPLRDFHISGPVFPAFLAASVALVGGSSINVHFLWPVLLGANSLVSALSCILIALIARSAFNRQTALVAGLAAAFYPAFIVNSGRLYSETFATFLLLLISYITVRGFSPGGNSMLLVFASGFLASALQLTRSVMVVLSSLLIPITFMQQAGKKKFLFILPFALGFSLLAFSWLGFQKLAFGGGGLVVDRVGNYNFFIGNNVDTQGWLSYPYPDGRGVEKESFGKLLSSSIEKSPGRWFRLMLDKPARLFAFPWNDFRTAIGPFSFELQVLYHQLVLLFAAAGICLFSFLSPKAEPEKKQLYARFYLLGLLGFHCIYFLFITVPRYNLTAMPELIIFAAAGLSTLIGMAARADTRKAALALLLSASLFFVCISSSLLPFLSMLGLRADLAWGVQAALRCILLFLSAGAAFCLAGNLFGKKKLQLALSAPLLVAMLSLLILPLRACGRYNEWYQDLSLSSPALKQTIRLPLSLFAETKFSPQNGVGPQLNLSFKDRGLYLLLDSSGVRQAEDGLSISVNGEKISAPVMPSLAFAENFDRFLPLGENKSVQREGECMWDSLSNSANCSNVDLRQWSMICLPGKLLEKAVARAESASDSYVSLELLVANRSLKALRVYGSYELGAKERLLPSVDLYSWEKCFYGVENKEFLTDTRYDIKVPAFTLVPSNEDLADAPGKQSGVFNVVCLLAPPFPLVSEAENANSAEVAAEKLAGLKLVQRYKIEDCRVEAGKDCHSSGLKLPLLKNREDGALYLYRVKGRSRSFAGEMRPQVQVDTLYRRADSSSFRYESAWQPKLAPSSREWRDFSFCLPIKALVESAEATEAILKLGISPASSAYQNVDSRASGGLEYADLAVELYKMPTNPIGLGHRVY